VLFRSMTKKQENSNKEYQLYIFQFHYTGNVLVEVLEVANQSPGLQIADFECLCSRRNMEIVES
jgi:hypothetical protein